VINIHTCSTGCLDLISVVVDIVYGQLVQLPSDVVSSTCVGVPVRIHTIVVHCRGGSLGRRCVALVEPILALK
jgi:hypothetical protein